MDDFFIQYKKEKEDEENDIQHDITYSLLVDYSENHTIKQLLKICEYYDIPKRTIKKMDIINVIMEFEMNPLNKHIVLRRKRMWFYISELKNDKKLKQHIFNFPFF